MQVPSTERWTKCRRGNDKTDRTSAKRLHTITNNQSRPRTNTVQMETKFLPWDQQSYNICTTCSICNKSSETFSDQHSPNSNPGVYEIVVLMETGYNTNRKVTERRNERIRYVKKGNNSSALAATLLWNRTHNKIWGHQDTNHRHTCNRTDVRQALEIARRPFYLNIRDNTWNIAIPWKHSNNQLNIFWPIVAAQVPVLSMNNQKCQKVTSQIIKRSNQQNSHSGRRQQRHWSKRWDKQRRPMQPEILKKRTQKHIELQKQTRAHTHT